MIPSGSCSKLFNHHSIIQLHYTETEGETDRQTENREKQKKRPINKKKKFYTETEGGTDRQTENKRDTERKTDK